MHVLAKPCPYPARCAFTIPDLGVGSAIHGRHRRRPFAAVVIMTLKSGVYGGLGKTWIRESYWFAGLISWCGCKARSADFMGLPLLARHVSRF